MSRIPNNKQQAHNPLEDLCCEIYQGGSVLLIGGDALLKDGLEGGGNNKKFIDYHLDAYLDENNLKVETTDERKKYISEFLKNEWNYDVEAEVNEDFVKLMKTKCFRVVVNTTFDGYVETVMRQIWGDELRVIRIYDNRDKSLFGTYSEFDIVPPTLIYAMGKADSPTAKYVYTEDDAIELIATRWLESTNRPNELINYIRGKKVLGIGCKLDDWEFRFFWYSLRQDLRSLVGDVAISLDVDKSDADRSLSQYLQRKGVKDNGNSREFLHLLQTQLNDPNKYVYESLQKGLQSGGVFISYASEDFNVACQISKLLMEKGCKVWFDNKELLGGDGYDYRISRAINECKVLVSVLSQQVAMDLENGTKRYYMSEWEQSADNIGCSIIPLTLYGFDFNKTKDKLPVAFSDKTAICWRDKIGSETLIKAVVDKLNNA